MAGIFVGRRCQHCGKRGSSLVFHEAGYDHEKLERRNCPKHGARYFHVNKWPCQHHGQCLPCEVEANAPPRYGQRETRARAALDATLQRAQAEADARKKAEQENWFRSKAQRFEAMEKNARQWASLMGFEVIEVTPQRTEVDTPFIKFVAGDGNETWEFVLEPRNGVPDVVFLGMDWSLSNTARQTCYWEHDTSPRIITDEASFGAAFAHAESMGSSVWYQQNRD